MRVSTCNRRRVRSLGWLMWGAVAQLMSPVAAWAVPLPAPAVFPVTLPAPDANAFDDAVAFGPSDGLMYVWNGASVLKQDSFNSSAFTSLGSVGSGSADAGPIAFSQDGSQILVGNGFGGNLGGANANLIFSIPKTGGDSSTSVGNVPFHFSFLPAPVPASNSRYFIDQGANAAGSASGVSIFDRTNGSNVSVLSGIPGASSSMAINSSGRLFVGIGFALPGTGELRSFAVADLLASYNSGTPLTWTSGAVFNTLANNSGSGMFFDSRGFLFTGGPHGVTVFDTQGHARQFTNDGFSTTVTYDPTHDRLLVTGFGVEAGIYSAGSFLVPEPATAVLALIASVLLVPLCRHVRRSTSRG